jgi:hypothetical protein
MIELPEEIKNLILDPCPLSISLNWAEVYYKLGRIYDIRTAAGVEAQQQILEESGNNCDEMKEEFETAEKERHRMGNLISFA